jgi:U3 small nucleolar RNA-associated protein 19
MPSTIGEVPLKRKRAKVSEKPTKRAKPTSSEGESEDEDEDDPRAEILLLEDEILKSKKKYNNITTILDLVTKQDNPDIVLFATVSLCRVFLRLLASGSLSRKPGQSERETLVIQWLKGKFSDYKKLLVEALGQEEKASTALTLCMRLLKAETQITVNDKNEVAFPKAFLRDIVGTLVRQGFDDVKEEFYEKYLGEYADIRFYTFQALR